MQRLAYFKRFRMELDLDAPVRVPPLPGGYGFVPWHDGLMDAHAEVKYASFQAEIDASVFPALGSRLGCQGLMSAIRGKANFCPASTWLIAHDEDGPVATIQGLRERGGLGAIQNVGVVPPHRGLGLGSCLVMQALAGFRAAGLWRAFLEVTARNDSAVRLYRRLGFRCRKTVYKAVEAVDAFV